MTGSHATQQTTVCEPTGSPAALRILFLGPDSANANHIADMLSLAGFDLTRAANAVQGLTAVGVAAPDLIVLDMAGPKDLQNLPAALAERAGFAKPPILGLAERAELVQTPRTDAADDIIVGRFGPELLLHRIKGLARLATLREELVVRRETVALFGPAALATDLAQTSVPARPRILIAALASAQSGRLAEIAGSFADIAFAGEPGGLRRLAQAGPCDAVMLGSAGGADRALATLADIRLYPHLYHLPVLLIDGPDGAERFDETAACAAGATGIIRGQDDGEAISLKLSVQIALQSQRNTLRSSLASLCRDAITDSLTGLFAHGFLMQHIDAHLERSRPRPTSVGVFVIKDLDRLNGSSGYAAGDHLIRQISGMLGGLIRGEDCAGRLAGHKLGVLLPNTSKKDADLVLHRIAGVANHTSLMVVGCERPFRPRLLCGAAEAAQADRAVDVIERAARDCSL